MAKFPKASNHDFKRFYFCIPQHLGWSIVWWKTNVANSSIPNYGYRIESRPMAIYRLHRTIWRKYGSVSDICRWRRTDPTDLHCHQQPWWLGDRMGLTISSWRGALDGKNIVHRNRISDGFDGKLDDIQGRRRVSTHSIARRRILFLLSVMVRSWLTTV